MPKPDEYKKINFFLDKKFMGYYKAIKYIWVNPDKIMNLIT